MIAESAHIVQVAQEALRMAERGVHRQRILAVLVSEAELLAGPGAVCSILVLDKNGLLRNGASPRLPVDYLKAIDGIKPDPDLGTCAAAAATGQMVITLDFQADNKWAELKHLPMALGFVGAWSWPIKNYDGRVLGTFGTYFREHRAPTKEEIASVSTLATAAAMVLSRMPASE